MTTRFFAATNSDLVSAAEADFQSNLDNVIMNVQIACFTVMQAEQVVTVNQEALDRAADRLQLARAPEKGDGSAEAVTGRVRSSVVIIPVNFVY